MKIKLLNSIPLLLLSPFCSVPGTDPEDVIRNAFACFDEEGTGKIHEDRYVQYPCTHHIPFTQYSLDAYGTAG